MDLIDILFSKALLKSSGGEEINNDVATKEFVNAAIDAIKNGVSEEYDTLKEIENTLTTKLTNSPTEWPTWTKEQQAIARGNIGAADLESVSGLKGDVAQLAEDMTGKLSEPAEGLAVGKYFRVAALDANGHAVLEAVDAKTVGVQDVTVNGESIVKDSVANIKANGHGIGFNNIGLYLASATNTQVAARLNSNVPLTPINYDYAVKLAMCDGEGAAWTADEQAKARERMSVENGSDFELLVDAVLEEEANTFLVQFPKPVRECMYHIWFYNNNDSNVVAQTKCLDSGTNKYYLLKYTSSITTGRGYALNGYFRYNGPIHSRSIIGYASDSSVPTWTTDVSGNGNVAYMVYPTDMILKKVDGLSFSLADINHVLNVGATIKVWGR